MLRSNTAPIAARRAAQRGLSLVEMMVGIAVGLIVVAGASLVVSTQLNENRRLLVETQLQQDLRAAMDIITRELRRMGAQTEDDALASLASSPLQTENDMARRSATAGGGAVSELNFHYQPGSGLSDAQGLKLEGTVLKAKVGAAWQELTDSNVMEITAFSITPTHSSKWRLPCPNLCPDDTTNCWPHLMVRELKVLVTGKARAMPEVVRTLESNVRVRNDVVSFYQAPALVCPS